MLWNVLVVGKDWLPWLIMFVVVKSLTCCFLDLYGRLVLLISSAFTLTLPVIACFYSCKCMILEVESHLCKLYFRDCLDDFDGILWFFFSLNLQIYEALRTLWNVYWYAVWNDKSRLHIISKVLIRWDSDVEIPNMLKFCSLGSVAKDIIKKCISQK